eukprot:scaffold58399_cov69-Phaeocystis_antarctica.AAC.3
MPRHARGANSRPRSRPHAVPERLDDRVWVMPSSSSPTYSGAIHARIVCVLLSCVIHGNSGGVQAQSSGGVQAQRRTQPTAVASAWTSTATR